MNGAALVAHPPLALGGVCWPSDEARAWVTELVRRANDDPAIVALVLYGSAVRNAEDPGDVDLLLVARGASPGADVPMDVDLRAYEAGDVEARAAADDEVLGWALRFGVAAFERDDFWSNLVARWDGRLPLPSADVAEARAARALRAASGLRDAGDDEAADEVRLSALRQLARARLLRAGIFPLSRPELPDQLIRIGEHELAAEIGQVPPAQG